jgi:ABC-type multidrug transport system ATPase subunit
LEREGGLVTDSDLVVHDVAKVYGAGVWRRMVRGKGGVRAVDGVSFTCEGGMFGLLGPNGAGKTTLMKICATLLEPTSGEVFFRDISVQRYPERIRALLGYLPQEFGAYPGWTLYEMLDYLALIRGTVNGKKRRDEVLRVSELTNLTEHLRKKMRTLSGGTKQRFGIAQALLNDPPLLIVDEPTAGLDPEERSRFRNLLADISANKVVLLSTHIVEDISLACPKMAVMNRGKIVAIGKPSALIEGVRGRVWVVQGNEPDYQRLKTLASLSVVEADAFRETGDWKGERGKAALRISSVLRDGDRVRIKVVSEKPPRVDRVAPADPSLEDAYLWYVHSGPP